MPYNKPLLVGITGGIGAGKSIVSKVFEILGIPKYDADSRAKWLMSNDPKLVQAITSLFGAEAYQEDQLNRKHIAAKAFDEKSLLGQLNQLVHPAVGHDFISWAQSQSTPYILKEAALLFETGSYKDLDKIITVIAPESTRIQRVIKRDQRTEEQVKAIISNQMSEEEKIAQSDFVVTNDNEHLVIEQVLKIHHTLLDQISR